MFGLLGTSCGFLGACWSPFGASWGPLGRVLGYTGGGGWQRGAFGYALRRGKFPSLPDSALLSPSILEVKLSILSITSFHPESCSDGDGDDDDTMVMGKMRMLMTTAMA
eukprot:3599194-Pyramimonas_sp.AAC.1